MSLFRIVRKSLNEIKIQNEIQNLREKYEDAIQHKLKMRGFMHRAIKCWVNLPFSKAWRKWKLVRALPTYYESVKKQVKDDLMNSRKKLFFSIKSSRLRHFQNSSRAALEIKKQKQSEIDLIHNRKSKEIRIKTARVKKMRDKLTTASKMSRENLMLRRISSAKEIRTMSRARLTSPSDQYL